MSEAWTPVSGHGNDEREAPVGAFAQLCLTSAVLPAHPPGTLGWGTPPRPRQKALPSALPLGDEESGPCE